MSKKRVVTETADEARELLLTNLDKYIAELQAFRQVITDADDPREYELLYIFAKCHQDDEGVDTTMGFAMSAILTGQLLAHVAELDPDVVLGLMEGLASNPKTQVAVTAALTSLATQAMYSRDDGGDDDDDCGDECSGCSDCKTDLAGVEPEGSA